MPTALDRYVVYRRTDDTTLIPLASPTTQVGANSTAGASAVALGFTWRFDGTAFTTVDIAARGYLRFAGAVNTADNTQLFASSADVVLAPWWDDIETKTADGYVKTETQGTAPFRRFVCEWYCNANSAHTATDYESLKFQAVLYESSDRIAFRYGTRATGGTPATGSYSASIGAKGVTSVATDNYRDVWVENLTLGGSKTTTTANLKSTTDWPSWTVWIEPATPMSGRWFDLATDEVTGLQDPYGEPIWKLANNTNWLYANHCPSLVNTTPYQLTGETSATFCVPVTPSADGLTYEVYLQTYTSAGGDLTAQLDEDALADPQPLTGADWAAISTLSAVGTAAGWHEWTMAEVLIDPATACLRLTVSPAAGTIILGSLLIKPKALTTTTLPTSTQASGWVPQSIGQLRQEGAAVHPEWFNRAWKNIAFTLADRKQALWSSVWAEKTAASSTVSTAGSIAVSPAWLPLRGQAVTVRRYAHSASDNAEVRVWERGGNGVSFDVDANGGEYRQTSEALTLVGDQPVIQASVTPSGALSPMAVLVEWAPALSATDYILGTTPAPRLSYLFALMARLRLALAAHSMTGLATFFERAKGTGFYRRAQYVIPPGVKALQVRVARDDGDQATQAQDTSIYGVSSGAGGADEVRIPSPHARGEDQYPPRGQVTITAGSRVYDTAPAAAMDRLLESPTATTLGASVRERLDVTRGVGLVLIPIYADPSTI